MDSQIVQTLIDSLAKSLADELSKRIPTNLNEHPSLLTTDELATHLNIPKSWIYDRTRDNTIPHIKVGKYVRFSLPDVLTWLKNNHV